MTIRALISALPLLALGWLATLSAVALITDEAPAYVVLFPSDRFLGALPNGTSVLAASDISVTLTSDQTGFARSLYGQGARLVLPAGLAGCLPMPKTS